MKELRVNEERLWSRLMEMAQIGGTPKGGVCRVALTDEDKIGRDLFVKWCKAAGLSMSIDQMGNIFARRAGRFNDRPPILGGSHLDSQPTGGKFDGVYGVLAALEAIETLNDYDIVTDAPLEIVSWTNEEGARFAPAMIASGVFAGIFDLDYAYNCTDKEGLSIGDELERIGYKGEVPAKAREYKATFEVHI
jgi:N-carbamoyl-L-amino-acid hydrolase